MQELVARTGLSPYCLSVLYDFAPQAFIPAPETRKSKQKQVLLDVICNNTQIQVTHKDATTRRAVMTKREEELGLTVKRGLMTLQEKDYTLIHEMLGTGYTNGGHFVYCYYTGPERRSTHDLGQVQHWVPVEKKLLPLFHKRLGRDVSVCYGYASAQVTETRDGRQNLDIDMRYIAQRWQNSQQGSRCSDALRGQSHLFVAGQDYNAVRHTQQQQHQQHASQKQDKKMDVDVPLTLCTVPPPVTHAPHTMDVVHYGTVHNELMLCDNADESETDVYDRYAVTDDEYHHISDAEYDRLCAMPIPQDVQFSFRRFIDASRKSAFRTGQQPSAQYYDHDPIVVFDAAVLALNGELHSQGTLETVMQKHLRVIENDGVAQLLETMSHESATAQDIRARGDEYVWALMSIENVSRKVPDSLKSHFTEPRELCL
jgi:hypothetical protein